MDVGSPTAAVDLGPVPGAHLAVVGPDDAGADVVHAALAGLARQHRPGDARFLVAPLVAPADAAAAAATALLTAAGHEVATVPLPALTGVLADLAGFAGCSPQRPTYLALLGAEAASPLLSTVSPTTFRPASDDLRAVVQAGPGHGVHVLGWWRSLARLAADLGPSAREDVGHLLALDVPLADLQAFLGRYDLHPVPRPGRALLVGRAEEPLLVVPFRRPTGDAR